MKLLYSLHRRPVNMHYSSVLKLKIKQTFSFPLPPSPYFQTLWMASRSAGGITPMPPAERQACQAGIQVWGLWWHWCLSCICCLTNCCSSHLSSPPPLLFSSAPLTPHTSAWTLLTSLFACEWFLPPPSPSMHTLAHSSGETQS